MYRLKSWNIAFSHDVTVAILVSQTNIGVPELNSFIMQLPCFVATFRPFPSCLKPLFQSEAKYKATDIKILFYSHPNTTHFHKKGIVLGLLLKKRILGTRNGSFAGYVSENLLELYHLGHVCMEVGDPR